MGYQIYSTVMYPYLFIKRTLPVDANVFVYGQEVIKFLVCILI